jgi:hypothetical protein
MELGNIHLEEGRRDGRIMLRWISERQVAWMGGRWNWETSTWKTEEGMGR